MKAAKMTTTKSPVIDFIFEKNIYMYNMRLLLINFDFRVSSLYRFAESGEGPKNFLFFFNK